MRRALGGEVSLLLASDYMSGLQQETTHPGVAFACFASESFASTAHDCPDRPRRLRTTFLWRISKGRTVNGKHESNGREE